MYDTPKVVIDLTEYNELKSVKQQSELTSVGLSEDELSFAIHALVVAASSNVPTELIDRKLSERNIRLVIDSNRPVGYPSYRFLKLI